MDRIGNHNNCLAPGRAGMGWARLGQAGPGWAWLGSLLCSRARCLGPAPMPCSPLPEDERSGEPGEAEQMTPPRNRHRNSQRQADRGIPLRQGGTEGHGYIAHLQLGTAVGPRRCRVLCVTSVLSAVCASASEPSRVPEDGRRQRATHFIATILRHACGASPSTAPAAISDQ